MYVKAKGAAEAEAEAAKAEAAAAKAEAEAAKAADASGSAAFRLTSCSLVVLGKTLLLA